MSVIKHENQRVGVFLDAQNLYHSAKNLHRGRVNFEAVLANALAGRQLVRAIAYVITTETGEEKNFFEALTKIGIETKTKDLQIFSSGSKKADWDVGLAIDAVKLAPKLDVVVLASGDGDFVPLVEYLKMQGCQVEVITFGKSASGKLKEVADDFIDMDEKPGEYVMGRGSDRGAGRDERGADRGDRGFDRNPRENRDNSNRENRNSRPDNSGNNSGNDKPSRMTKIIRKLR